MDKNLTQELAQRLYDYIDPWDREDATVEDIANDITNDPLSVIKYLLDIVENI